MSNPKKDAKNSTLYQETNPGLCDDQTQCSIHWANQTNWTAGHCEFVIPPTRVIWPDHGGNDMYWDIWNESYFELRIKVWKWKWLSQQNEQLITVEKEPKKILIIISIPRKWYRLYTLHVPVHLNWVMAENKNRFVQPTWHINICVARRSPIGFFNPVIPTHNFVQSRNPEGYFGHSNYSAYFQSRILPILLKIPSPELQIREIPDPEKPIGDSMKQNQRLTPCFYFTGNHVCKFRPRPHVSGYFWITSTRIRIQIEYARPHWRIQMHSQFVSSFIEQISVHAKILSPTFSNCFTDKTFPPSTITPVRLVYGAQFVRPTWKEA